MPKDTVAMRDGLCAIEQGIASSNHADLRLSHPIQAFPLVPEVLNMIRIARFFVMFLAIAGLAAIDGSAIAQPKDKDKDNKEMKEHKVKGQKHHNGKSLVGDKIKQNGKHKFHENGKNSAFVDVKGGKIAGVTVTNADKGNVPVKKYKSTKKMAENGIQRVSFNLAQSQYLGSTWIGYSYVDEFGYETIYWFEYDMILDGDTGAVEYIPLY